MRETTIRSVFGTTSSRPSRRRDPLQAIDASTMLHSAQTYAMEPVLTSLLNDIAEMPEDFILVIDDYHLIKNDSIHDYMTFLLDHSFPTMHLVLATRADPRLPLAHFRGRGLMVELGADDLRFTSEETNDFFKLQDIELHREDLTALNAKAEGWVVGLKMAAHGDARSERREAIRGVLRR